MAANSVSSGIFGSLFLLYMAIALVVGALVLGWLAYNIVKFRARPGQPRPADAPVAGVVPAERGHPVWSYVMALVIGGIMFGLAFSTISAVHTLEVPPEEGDRLDIGLAGFQFGWRVTYVGEGGIPVAKVNEWTVPVDTAIVANVTSQDVWHNFALPGYRIRIDVVPGQTNHIWWKSANVETVEPVCVQLCGTNHALMKGVMHVVPKADFEAYLADETRAAYETFAKKNTVLNATFTSDALQVEGDARAGKAFAVNLTNGGSAEQLFTLHAPGAQAYSHVRIAPGQTAYLYGAGTAGEYALAAPGTPASAVIRAVS